MSASAIKQALNCIWDHNNALELSKENDDFTRELAGSYIHLRARLHPVPEDIWLKAISSKRTTFFQLNNTDRDHYLSALLPKLNRLKLDVEQNDIGQILLQFKQHIERQQRSEFRPKPLERVGRSLLLAFLQGRGLKEVPTGSGQMDILVVDQGWIIETKIWRSRQYYEDGLDEVIDYLQSENLDTGYYVVFVEKWQSTGLRTDLPGQDIFWHKRDNKRILVVMIDISQVPPSKKGALKRKLAKSP